VGGVIPPQDFAKLQALGVKAVFGPESPIDSIIGCVRSLAVQHDEPERAAGGAP